MLSMTTAGVAGAPVPLTRPGENFADRDLATYGFCRPVAGRRHIDLSMVVPVGADQVAHVDNLKLALNWLTV